ncbi:hypothetical protein HQQ80_12835 [Microbacteriaceae bacterium VKM Ac-2855]|nr:hypothetical protein [Microbacteriaceae bacterium VKM Ac-2855]
MTREEVVVRRSPRVWRILALGAGVGAVAAFVATFALPETPGFSKGQIFGFTLLGFVVIFVALAALLVIVLDRTVGRRTRTLQAERLTVGDESGESAVLENETQAGSESASLEGPDVETSSGDDAPPAR